MSVKETNKKKMTKKTNKEKESFSRLLFVNLFGGKKKNKNHF